MQASGILTMNSDTVIKVPADLYEEFTQAQYWSSYASKMIAA